LRLGERKKGWRQRVAGRSPQIIPLALPPAVLSFACWEILCKGKAGLCRAVLGYKTGKKVARWEGEKVKRKA